MMRNRSAFFKAWRGGALPACLLSFGALAMELGDAPKDPMALTAELMPRAAESLLLDIVDLGDGAVAVGERGHVLASADYRRWRQIANVPTRTTLTAIAAQGDFLWAVGHDGVILKSANRGENWSLRRFAPYQERSDDPQNGAPLLDVLFLDRDRGFAIGGYALMLHTEDGGDHWKKIDLAKIAQSAAGQNGAQAPDANAEGHEGSDWTFDQEQLALEQEEFPHLNAIARTGSGSLLIVAERGAAFRSFDEGLSWQRIRLPYDGSMFGAVGYEGDHVLAFGLRGNAFETADLGGHWDKIETGTELSLMGGTAIKGGGAVLVGANGMVLTRTRAFSNFLQRSFPGASVLSSAIAPKTMAEIIVVGETGVRLFPVE